MFKRILGELGIIYFAIFIIYALLSFSAGLAWEGRLLLVSGLLLGVGISIR